MTTSAKSNACVFPNELTSRSQNSEWTSYIQRTIGPGIDRCFLWLRLWWASIEALEVQRSRWTRHHYFGNFIGCRCIHFDPSSAFGLEDFRQPAEAISRVNAE